MFNSHRHRLRRRNRRHASHRRAHRARFVLWFNGNGIPERYWIPDRAGADYDITPCLSPLARLRDDVHVLSGLDNAASVDTAATAIRTR